MTEDPRPGRAAAGSARRASVRVGLAFACLLWPISAEAQRAFEVQAGKLATSGPDPTLYSASLWRPLIGPVDWSVRGLALQGADTADHSLYGLGTELGVMRGRARVSPYAILGAGLALEFGGPTDLAAFWSAGLGVEFNPSAWFGLALEATRFLEDASFRGFWNPDSSDRLGWALTARAAVRWGGPSVGDGSGSAPVRGAASYGARPSNRASEPLSEAGLRRAERIVETALDVMGEPYRWGGTNTREGFDCSGLVWYAYRNHEVSVPRVSRDQARVGGYVAPDPSLLEPADILLFAARRDAITHVGLYIGNGKFIHATTSGGVRVGALDGAADANDRWWIERWVGARRVLD